MWEETRTQFSLKNDSAVQRDRNALKTFEDLN